MRAMCGEGLRGRQIAKDLMLKMGLNETIGQLATANSIC